METTEQKVWTKPGLSLTRSENGFSPCTQPLLQDVGSGSPAVWVLGASGPGAWGPRRGRMLRPEPQDGCGIPKRIQKLYTKPSCAAGPPDPSDPGKPDLGPHEPQAGGFLILDLEPGAFGMGQGIGVQGLRSFG